MGVRSKTRVTGAAAVLASVALIASACGSSGSSASDSGAQSSDPAVAAAKKLFDTVSAEPVTGPSFGKVSESQMVPWSASAMPTPAPIQKNLKVVVLYGIPAGAPPYLANLITTVGAKFGWDVKTIKADDMSQTSIQAAFNSALLAKPDVILGDVVPGAWIGDGLAQAKKAGIVTVNMYQDPTTGPGYDAWVPTAQGIQKSLLGAYAVEKSNGKANVQLLNAPGFSDADVPAATALIKGCQACSAEEKQLEPTHFNDPTAIQSDVTNLLNAKPDTSYIVWPNGSLPTAPVLTAIQNSGASGATLLMNSGSPSGLEEVRDGSVPILPNHPEALLALAAMDQVNRLVAGKPALAPEAQRFPIYVWTKDNAPASGSDYSGITQFQVKQADFIAPFSKAWGTDITSAVLSVKE